MIYLATSAGKTPYDYFTRLAEAFLQGRVWLTENPSWLSELIPLGNNKFTFVNPPMPAILAVPFVLVFKTYFHQEHLAHLLGTLAVTITGFLAWKIKPTKKFAIWAMLLLGLGSIFWYLAATGSVWYLGQVTVVLFLTAAIYESVTRKRPTIIALLLVATFLSRLQTTLSLPFFLFVLLERKSTLVDYLKFFGVLSLFFIIYCSYNFLRFGSILENGYTLIPGILQEPWFDHGQFSLSYIPKHLELLFLKLPTLLPDFPYIRPSWAGMAIWISTPTFIFALFARLKNKINLLAWVSILLIGFVNFSYGSTGFSQFGYRYAVDFYPFLIFLTLQGVNRGGGPKWYHWLLLIVSIIVNCWGVLWINKFGWVAF